MSRSNNSKIQSVLLFAFALAPSAAARGQAAKPLKDSGPTLHVVSDGSGEYKTVQAAVDSMPATGGIIVLASGTYREQVIIKQSHVTLRSADPDSRKTVIVDDTSQGTRGSKPSYATVHVTGDDFRAENITFENDFNRTHEQASSGSQAQALNLEGDRNILSNVRVLGNQDTLYIGARGCGQAGSRRPAIDGAGTGQPPAPCVPVATRTYLTHCFVAGNVDFIYGDGTVSSTTARFITRSMRLAGM